MDKSRDTFMLRAGHYKMFCKRLSLEQKGHLLDAIFCDRLGEDYTQHIEDELVGMAFDMMREFYLQCDESYRKRSETNSANAKKRFAKDANASDGKQSQAIAEIGIISHTKSISISKSNSKSISVNNTAPQSRFVKPTVEQVATYAASIGYKDFEADVFWDFYESKGWKVGGNPMKDWKAAARNWNRRKSEQQLQLKFNLNGNNTRNNTAVEQRSMVCHDWSNERSTI